MIPPADPMVLFHEWFEAAHHIGLPEPSAAALATADREGRPSIRTVLVRAIDERGFAFYTNLRSRKGHELLGRPEAVPRACLNFYWPPVARQVRIEGTASPVPDAEADAYWASRPRGHQVAAYASPQSEVIAGGRKELEALFADWDKKLPRSNVPRPAFWSGFRVVPETIEFWQGRENRLHERILYRRENGRWVSVVLGP
jgi:pyridoxamine 5'-phosphate oxidase